MHERIDFGNLLPITSWGGFRPVPTFRVDAPFQWGSGTAHRSLSVFEQTHRCHCEAIASVLGCNLGRSVRGTKDASVRLTRLRTAGGITTLQVGNQQL